MNDFAPGPCLAAFRRWRLQERRRVFVDFRMVGRLLFATSCLSYICDASGAIVFENVPQLEKFSAVVAGPDGHLVRTLFSNERRSPDPGGIIRIDWDGLDDFGIPVPPGEYAATLVGNNVHYVWEGTLGNTSADAAIGGAHVFRSFEPIRQMAIDPAGDAFFVTGYNEQGLHFTRFPATHTHRPSQFLFDDFTRTFTSVATDGKLAYFANVGTIGSLNCSGAGNQGTRTFLVATVVKDDTQYDWQGAAQRLWGMPGAAGSWFGVDVEANAPSADCKTPDNLSGPERWRHAANGGIAVQRLGRKLFAAHTDENSVHVLDKNTGQLEAEIPITAPSSICTAADDSLWVLSTVDERASLLHYQANANTWVAIGSIALRFKSPLAIGCNPADGSVAVIDGESMRVRDFDAAGHAAWTIGLPGGYRSAAPDVRPDRFGFLPGFAYIAFLQDGSFWLGDPFNFRNLLFSASGHEVTDQIAYLPATYRIAVDRSEPQRVFAQFLEFSVDYAKPAAGSWTLVRNWKSGLGSDYVPNDFVNTDAGIQRPLLLPNGRTYATVFNFSRKMKEVVELDAAKGLRPTGIFLPFGVQMYGGGTLRHDSGLSGDCGNPCRIFEKSLTGFDDKDNPQWGPDHVVAQMPGIVGIDPVHTRLDATYLSEPAFPETRGHHLISFNAARMNGFHLGSVSRNASQWDWRASRAAPFQTVKDAQGFLGIVSAGSAFPIDNDAVGLPVPPPKLGYAGGTVDAIDDIVVFSYPGEGWNGAEASQFMAFDAGGAMLGQFGTPGYPSINRLRALPGFAGNAYCIALASVGGRTFLYTSDESGSGGIQRWEIAGLDAIRRLTVPVLVAP